MSSSVKMFFLFLYMYHISCINSSESIQTDTVNKIFCPSQFVNDRNKNVFSYPLDLYQTNNQLHEISENYICDSFERLSQTHTCSYKSYCPLREENIVAAQAAADWETKPSLCSFKTYSNALSILKPPINIILLGGSVTAGHRARGCCCSDELNNNCPKSILCNQELEFKSDYRSYLCSWGMHFERYLYQTYNHIHVYNLAIPSTDSYGMQKVLDKTLQHKHITLKAEDIIFIDFSVNDGGSIMTGKMDAKRHVKEGLERIVRRLIQLVKSSSSGFWPTIVILDMWPVGEVASSDIYADVARHYGLHFWSYRDVAKSEFASSQQSEFVHYLNFDMNGFVFGQKGPFDPHPPWHIHMFYADLVSNLFHRAVAGLECPDEVAAYNATLPTPITRHRAVICTPNSPIYLNIDLKRPDVEASLLQQLEIEPERSWEYLADRPDKYGLVSVSSSLNPLARVTIPFDSVEPEAELTVIIDYMRTYEAAAVLEITVCGSYLFSIDALWEEFSSVRLSKTASISLDMTTRFVSTACAGRSFNTIELTAEFGSEARNQKKKAARGPLQKFKLESITICHKSVVDLNYSDLQ